MMVGRCSYYTRHWCRLYLYATSTLRATNTNVGLDAPQTSLLAHTASNGPVLRQPSWFPPGTRALRALGHCSPPFESNIVTARDTCPGHDHDEVEWNLAVRRGGLPATHCAAFKNQLGLLSVRRVPLALRSRCYFRPHPMPRMIFPTSKTKYTRIVAGGIDLGKSGELTWKCHVCFRSRVYR